MPLTFDDDECYRLLLAIERYTDVVTGQPAAAAGAYHLGKCIDVYVKLKSWHNAHRAEDGHPPCYPDVSV